MFCKRHHFGPDDHVLFNPSLAPKTAKKQVEAPAPALFPVQRDANMPRNRKHEQSKDDNWTSVEDFEQMEAPAPASSPVQREANMPRKRKQHEQSKQDEHEQSKDEHEEDEDSEHILKRKRTSDPVLANDDPLEYEENTSSARAANGIGSKARDSFESPFQPLNLRHTLEEVETTPVVHIIKKASDSMKYFDTCFNMSLQEYGFPWKSEDEPSEASEEVEHEPFAPEEIEATVARAEASEDEPSEASEEVEHEPSEVSEEVEHEPSEASEEVEHEPFAPEETETTVARAAEHGIGSKVFAYRRDLNVPRPIPFYSSEESDEEDTRPFDEISINKDPPSEDEASEEEEEDDVISLSSDEGSEVEDYESFDESFDDEDSDDESNDIPAEPGLRGRGQTWTPEQSILLLIAAEDSRGASNINWDAVMEHACIKILLEERPDGTRKKFQRRYNNLRKTENEEKYQSLMAVL
ncbi:predicted protein [Chaetoceros tenuissimus]|uniref:Myb-like domain-containing protein n=1 Tax=Chaetoceros tenuissimus TaxID=426638 RepID=A0AAD3CGR0_9STRA|nr:predicted protein [Chaetoceros tenuissimus]